jgi:hypothetical protein
LVSFWLLSAIQLAFLIKTLPNDQAAMEDDLVARYITTDTTGIPHDVEKNGILESATGNTTPIITGNHSRFKIEDETTALLSKDKQQRLQVVAEHEPEATTTTIEPENISPYKTFQQQQFLETSLLATSIEPISVTIEERIASFDDVAAKETLTYVRDGLLELSGPILYYTCGVVGTNNGAAVTGTSSSSSYSVNNNYNSRSNSSMSNSSNCDDSSSIGTSSVDADDIISSSQS